PFSPSLPTRRSSDLVHGQRGVRKLVRQRGQLLRHQDGAPRGEIERVVSAPCLHERVGDLAIALNREFDRRLRDDSLILLPHAPKDRKSTRLNSSHEW